MKVHLLDIERCHEELKYSWCGLWYPSNSIWHLITDEIAKVTCKACLKAYQAWQKRKEASHG